MYTTHPAQWNYENLNLVTNKPAAQYAFQDKMNSDMGKVRNWVTFLNCYFWLQNYVDQQVGVVLDALASSSFAGNTVVIFTSDHGEFGGSHGLHDKGAAAYEEAIRVPLYVQFPGQTGAIGMDQMTSSVDFFGLICDLATGGTGQWTTQYPDLARRQSVWRFLYANSEETRIAPSLGIPYIFHTCDQVSIAPGEAKFHLAALRTKYNAALSSQPGAKLGVYYKWEKCTTTPDDSIPDYEFYDYNPATSHNTAETGNDFYSLNPTTIATIDQYLEELGSWGPPSGGLIGSELNAPLIGTGTDGNPLTQPRAIAQQNYIRYVWGTDCTS